MRYRDGWNKRNTNTKTAPGFKDAFPAFFFFFLPAAVSSGMFAKSQLSVCLGNGGGSR